ncbi:MAG TPA: glycosyltransferase family 39 protein [Solirubrobacteraceae bacterium]
MATVTAPQQSVPPADDRSGLQPPVPDWLARVPLWLVVGAVTLIVMAISAWLRTRYIGGQYWMDEGLSVGISSHSLLSIPSVLRHDGSPPLYYLMLHVWMSVFGSSESATHALSLVFALLCIPAGMWVAWSLFGRWAAAIALVLFALNPFLTAYGQETRMYSLMAFLGLLATLGFIQGFIYRRRGYLILFTVCQVLMLYTHLWGAFFGVGAFLAFLVVWRASDDRRAILRDGLYVFGACALLYLPWVPTLLYQATHTGSPWDSSPNFGAPVQISRNLMGGDRATVALVLIAGLGIASMIVPSKWRSRESLTLWALLILPIGALGFGWIVSHVSPAWAYRYFAPILGSLLLLATLGFSRSKGLGVLGLILVILFWANPSELTPHYKSDMRDIAGETGPRLHKGDLVILGQPEEVPLAWYYLPAGLRFANPMGTPHDPQSMNWVNALARLKAANINNTVGPLIARLKPNQQVLYVRPLTEGAQNWESPWTQLVRRRSAQIGALLASDPSLREVAWAPHNYRGSCCVANSALLFRKL